MNLYKEMSKNEIKLLENAGIKVEDKDYTTDELKKCENDIVEYIMLQSSKNIDNYRNKYYDILRRIV